MSHEFAAVGASIRSRIERDADRRSTELASPVGVVLAIVPVTNPVATAMFKPPIALKGRNALILSLPQRAIAVGRQTAGIVSEVFEAHGAPPDLVQLLDPSDGRLATRTLMGHPKVSLIRGRAREKIAVRVGRHIGECEIVAGIPRGVVVDIGSRAARSRRGAKCW